MLTFSGALAATEPSATPKLPALQSPVVKNVQQPLIVTPQTHGKTKPEPEFKLPPPTLPATRFDLLEIADDRKVVAERLMQIAKEIRVCEVWSLDPNVTIDPETPPTRIGERFHDFQVIARKELKATEDIQSLLFAVTLAIAQGPEETGDCFAPRHGLRLHTKQGFLDVVLCYQCLNGRLFDGENQFYFSTSKEPETEFDAIFTKLGLKKAD